MFTPVKNNYGYGVALSPMANHRQIGHGGGINGFTSYIARFPDNDAVVIVLSNYINAAAVANSHLRRSYSARRWSCQASRKRSRSIRRFWTATPAPIK